MEKDSKVHETCVNELPEVETTFEIDTNKEYKLIVHSYVSVVIWPIAILSIIILNIWLNIWFNMQPDDLIWKILWNIVMAGSIVYLIFYYVYTTCQMAIVSKDGILIRNIFCKLKFISWQSLVQISIESFLRAPSEYWIYLVTDREGAERDNNKFGGLNSKRKGSWTIYCYRKNVAIINKFAKKYCV